MICFFDEIKLVIIERFFIHLHYFMLGNITVIDFHKDFDVVGVQIFFINVKHNLSIVFSITNIKEKSDKSKS